MCSLDKINTNSKTIWFHIKLFLLALLIPFGIKKSKKTNISKRKSYSNIQEKHPDLICDKHFRRTVEKLSFIRKKTHCRINKKCFSLGRITHAKLLIGIIGDYKRSRSFGNEYSTMIWDNDTRKIIDGDRQL